MNDNLLFTGLDNALIARNNVLNNHNSYYYTVTIEVKHSHRVCGIKVEPTYSYHPELRFNHGLLNQHVNEANHRINEAQARINFRLNEYKSSLLEAQRNTDYNIQRTESLKVQIHDLKNLTKSHYLDHNRIREKIIREQDHNRNMSNEAASIQSAIPQLKTQIERLHIDSERKKTEIDRIKVANDVLQTNLDEVQKRTIDSISGKTEEKKQDRAEIFSQLITDKNAEFLINSIKIQGFDAGHLAYKAYLNNNVDLLSHAVEHNTNCLSFQLKNENQTLFEKILASNNQELITEALETADLKVCLLIAMSNMNIRAIETILGYDPSHLDSDIHGYSIFLLAVANGKIELVTKLLEIKPACVRDENDWHESAFKIALRSSTDEIIKLIASKIDVNQELTKLFEEHETDLLLKSISVITEAHISNKAFLTKAIGYDATEIIEKLIEQNPNILQELYQDAFAHGNQELKNDLALICMNYDLPAFADDHATYQIGSLGNNGYGTTIHIDA